MSTFFKSVEFTSGTDFKNVDMVVDYDNMPAAVRVVFDRANRIAGVTFKPQKR